MEVDGVEKSVVSEDTDIFEDIKSGKGQPISQPVVEVVPIAEQLESAMSIDELRAKRKRLITLRNEHYKNMIENKKLYKEYNEEAYRLNKLIRGK